MLKNFFQEEYFDFQSPQFLQKCYDRLSEIENDLSFSERALYNIKPHPQESASPVEPVSSEYFESTARQDSATLSQNETCANDVHSTWEDLISQVRERMASRRQTRLDEVLKFTIRRMLKKYRRRFQNYYEELTGHISYKTCDPRALEPILVGFIFTNFNEEIGSELNIAQAIFYNHKAKTLQESRMELELVTKGTKKGALQFFKYSLTRNIIYPEFKYVLQRVSTLVQSSLRCQIVNLVREIECIGGRSTQSTIQ